MTAAHHHGALRRLGLVLGITAAFTVAELAGGWLANSLALLADAGHMFADALALGLALVAAWIARRPPDPARTYGYQRIEILAALLNGVALVVIALLIFVEAWKRLADPPPVHYALMALVATLGLAVNLAGAWLLHGSAESLNVRAAYLHVLGDLFSSIGTLAAAGAMWALGWLWADPLVSLLIAAVIVVSAVRLVLESVNVLMEGAPAHLDAERVRASLAGLAGVCEVHDLHLWSLGGDRPLLTAHLMLDHSRPADQVLREATALLRERFDISHATLQLEPPDFNIVVTLTTARQ